MNERGARRRIVILGLRSVAAVSVGIVLLGQLGQFIPLLDPLNALLSALCVLLALLLALSLRWNQRLAAAICTLGLVIAALQLASATFRPDRRTLQPSEPTVRVLTLSTFHANPQPKAIRSVVSAAAPDIAIFQETDGTAGPVIDGLLPGYFRVKSCTWNPCSLTILSRWPARRIIPPVPKGHHLPDILVVEIQAPFGPLRVIGVHLPRPGYKRAPQFYEDLVATAKRYPDMPLLIAGDFNMATGSFGLTRFARHTGMRAMEGFIPTYPANLPVPAFVAIDHVFADRRWSAATCNRTASGHSDHFGVVCRLSLPKR